MNCSVGILSNHFCILLKPDCDKQQEHHGQLLTDCLDCRYLISFWFLWLKNKNKWKLNASINYINLLHRLIITNTCTVSTCTCFRKTTSIIHYNLYQIFYFGFTILGGNTNIRLSCMSSITNEQDELSQICPLISSNWLHVHVQYYWIVLLPDFHTVSHDNNLIINSNYSNYPYAWERKDCIDIIF